MKQTMKRFATGTAWSLIILAGSTFAAVPEASAHGVTTVRYVDYHNHHHRYRQSTRIFPRWLRAKHDFQRWYFRGNYRRHNSNTRYPGWSRLYDLYLHDTRHLRRAWRHSDEHDRYDRHSNERHRRRRR